MDLLASAWHVMSFYINNLLARQAALTILAQIKLSCYFLDNFVQTIQDYSDSSNVERITIINNGIKGQSRQKKPLCSFNAAYSYQPLYTLTVDYHELYGGWNQRSQLGKTR
jgi:hypothetical protein